LDDVCPRDMLVQCLLIGANEQFAAVVQYVVCELGFLRLLQSRNDVPETVPGPCRFFNDSR
jgi:hypothetical protein